MNKETLILFAAVAIAIGGLATLYEAPSDNIRVNKQPKTVPYVDVASYLGAWYEQSTIPFYFERGCSKTIAKYSMNADGKTIRVDNSCVRDGKLRESVGKAIAEDDTHAKLKVEFVETLDIGGQYWIVRLAKDYSYSVVSSPNYRYLWILYRQPHMPETLYQEIIADLKKDDFPVEKLVRTEQ